MKAPSWSGFKRFAQVDPGFGQKYNVGEQRMLNKNGSFNVRKSGTSLHMYQELITMSWTKFSLLMTFVYLFINLIFAELYMVAGAHTISIETTFPAWKQHLYAFYFSIQTMTSVGYGAMNPSGTMSGLIASIESTFGFVALALATGLLYGRFSKPSSGIVFAEKALIAPYKDGYAFMFKLANSRKNILIDISASLMLAIVNEENGERRRAYMFLKMEREHINFLPMSWTGVHPIDENSPLWGKTAADLKEAKAEFFLMIRAHDDTFSQTIHSNTSYHYDEIEWYARYLPGYETGTDGKLHYDLNKLSDFVKVPPPDTLNA